MCYYINGPSMRVLINRVAADVLFSDFSLYSVAVKNSG